MEKRKLTKQDIDKVRDIEGFPIGSDEDIIALSDAPYYTACPNPFIEEFIQEYGHPYDEETDDYQREPYAADVSEDKHDLIYNIHSYHTKVPPKAIKKLIEHYTEPGDIVLDSFCGTGMTGIAAQMCSTEHGALAPRNAILSDLSPIASFIAANYNSPLTSNDLDEIEEKLQRIQKELGELYTTVHVQDGEAILGIGGQPIKGTINYTVWSDILICPQCSTELVYYDVAVDKKTNKTQKEFLCPHCGLLLSKAKCSRAVSIITNPNNASIMQVTKSVPVLINYSVGKTRFNKMPDLEDIEKLKSIHVDYSCLPNHDAVFPAGDKTPEMHRNNIKYIWQLYKDRTLSVLQKYLEGKTSLKGLFLLTSTLPKLTILNRFMPEHGSRALVGPMAGTFYLPAMYVENNAIHQLDFQFKKLKNLQYKPSKVLTQIDSATSLKKIPSDSIDYVFIDPPFGANIMYSELNIVSESWLRIFTNNNSEAIMNNTQRKTILEYQKIMTDSFLELKRVLKPNRWITIEFHNSKNSVWNAIQEAVNRAGFIIADVRTLNKEKKTINQFNAKGTVDQDLVITAYKPKSSFTKEFSLRAGTEKTAWAFVQQHLANLPITVKRGGQLEMLTERQAILLWDRMVAYHVMHGIAVPLDAADFYNGLDEKFLKRDNMYFLPNQVNKYDKIRATCDVENLQYAMFISDERTAISWLYQQLDVQNGGAPQTYQEIMPKFMKELTALDKREKLPELSVLLEENFLKNERGEWYVPDYKKSGDVAKLREKNLLKEFAEYQQGNGKIKVFRSEAIRAGFAKLWKEKNYIAIVKMAERLPEETIQEDQNLLMYYDISVSRAERQPSQTNISFIQ